MKEIVIISGKGGTGKTSLTASFAALSKRIVLADCDVDAADLHLLLSPEIKEKHIFKSGKEAVIDPHKCINCNKCVENCRFGAIEITANQVPQLSPSMCEGCGVCVMFCPAKAIDFPERVCGEYYISKTRFGTMVHAHLGIGSENSGKLVTMVRNEAQKHAQSSNAEILLIDGPPGIGCPVIASISNVDAVIIVTEPTLSGKHDMVRVKELADFFNIPVFICVNKWDINPSLSDEIEEYARQNTATFLGRISYSEEFTQAQLKQKTIIEYSDCQVSRDVRLIWQRFNLKNAVERSKNG